MTVPTADIGRSGVVSSRIGLGTWAIGGTDWGGTNAADAEAAIRQALDDGISLIDTAPVYGFGVSEEIVGRAIKGRRDEVVLSTKCGMVWGGGEGEFFFDTDRGAMHRYLGAKSIRHELTRSLRRLQTDYIDIYHTHFQESVTPLAETVDTLKALREEGLIRAIGVSNCSADRLKEYLALDGVDCAQESYSMLERGRERDTFPVCKQNGVSALAYSPLAMGLLTGKIAKDRMFEAGDVRRGNPRFTGASLDKVGTLLDKLRPIAASYGVTLAQLVIAWTLSRQKYGVTHVLCGARNANQARENAAAAMIVLAEADRNAMTEAVDAAAIDLPAIYG